MSTNYVFTKQQLFDLQFKWNYPSKFRDIDYWWNLEEYWEDIFLNCDLDPVFIKEFNPIVNFSQISLFPLVSPHASIKNHSKVLNCLVNETFEVASQQLQLLIEKVQ